MSKGTYVVDDSYTPDVEVARKATEEGYKMNTATARHIFYRGLEKVAYAWLVESGEFPPSIAKEKCKEVAKSLDFQHVIRDILEDTNQIDR